MARDMTKGNITGHLIAYAVPLVFGNLFQQLYHTVDSVVVGQFYGKEALAAVGAAGPIMNILTFLIVGLSLGASILMASYFGAKDYQDLKDEFATSVLSGLLLTIVLSGISLARKPPVYPPYPDTGRDIGTGVLVFADYLTGSYFYLFLQYFLRRPARNRRFQSAALCPDPDDRCQCIPGCIPGWHLPPRCFRCGNRYDHLASGLCARPLRLYLGESAPLTPRHPGSETENLDAQKNDRFQLHFRRPADDSLRRPPARPVRRQCTRRRCSCRF